MTTKYECVHTAIKLFELEVTGWMRDAARDGGFPAARDAVDIARNNVIELAMAANDDEAEQIAIKQAMAKKVRA